MNTIKKLLIASTMVVTLSAVTSCNNKKNNNEFAGGGLPYTLVRSNKWLDEGEELTLGFDYTGKNMKVYWGDNIEEASTDKFHTFIGDGGEWEPYFIVEGDITSIWFTDKDGNSIQDGNDTIRVIIFSNTITSLPKYACASIMDLKTVFIPKSVKKIGEYAFTPSVYYRHDAEGIYCEAEDRPSTWSPNWYYGPIMGNLVRWGFSYYIFDDGQAYIIYNRNGNSAAAYMGYAFPTDIKKVVIPQTIEINKYKFDVTFILDTGYEDNSVEELEINNNVEYIYSDAFYECENLKTVNFIGDFDFLYFEDYVFGYCEQLESATLPNGLINLSCSLFEGCDKLISVNIPSTVQHFSSDVFYSACEDRDLKIDLTGYKTVESIPNCEATRLFNNCHAQTVTFTYAKTVGVEAFTSKGWPAAGPTIEEATVTWIEA